METKQSNDSVVSAENETSHGGYARLCDGFKLVTMCDFIQFLQETPEFDILHSDQMLRIIRYKEFLKQPIELWMFVACDEDGSPLHDNEWKNFEGTLDELKIVLDKHEAAKAKTLFPGFKYIGFENGEHVIMLGETKHYIPFKKNTYQTIEEPLVRQRLKLTNNAINRIFG